MMWWDCCILWLYCIMYFYYSIVIVFSPLKFIQPAYYLYRMFHFWCIDNKKKFNENRLLIKLTTFWCSLPVNHFIVSTNVVESKLLLFSTEHDERFERESDSILLYLQATYYVKNRRLLHCSLSLCLVSEYINDNGFTINRLFPSPQT